MFSPGLRFSGAVSVVMSLTAVGSGARAKSAVIGSDDRWQFRQYYPRHYVNLKLEEGEQMVIDGSLNDSAWERASWTEDFVDITDHQDNETLNEVPAAFQTRVKMRWDADYLYVGAELREPFLYGNITGHNSVAPYHDNDFEVFIDVSGTTHYYKEYEMNMLNATYDINWGAPDGLKLDCALNDTASEVSSLPVCVNTSFPGYAGNWSMFDYSDATRRGIAKGLVTATSYDVNQFGKFSGTGHAGQANVSVWTAEMAFPIRSSWSRRPVVGVGEGGGGWHGGLLDTTWSQDQTALNYSRFNPNNGDAGDGRPTYWRMDFARAEHPRRYNVSRHQDHQKSKSPSFTGSISRLEKEEDDDDSAYTLCPLRCPASLGTDTPVSVTNPTAEECADAAAQFPTLLGTDPFYGCYWEWVWQSLGFEAYMHRPTRWSVVQFVDAATSAHHSRCDNIEWPGRYIAKLLFEAENTYAKLHGGHTFTADLHELVGNVSYCQLPACNITDLQYAASASSVFDLAIDDVKHGRCEETPCYVAKVGVKLPESHRLAGSPYAGYSVSVNENLLITVDHDAGTAPCL